MKRLQFLPCVLVVVMLSACAHREVLMPMAADNPLATSFAAQWTLRGDRKLIDARLQQAIRATDGVRDGQVLAQPRDTARYRSANDGRIKGGLVYVFFENGESLKISQTDTALFVSFDRAIVEEYRFGEDRVIKVGQAEAQRVSGWDGADYVIETLDRTGMKLTERYQLAADRQTLTRRITFRASNGQEEAVTQLFARR